MGEKDKSQHRAPSASLTDAEENPAGDSKLAQRIWDHYGSSPGVITLDSVLQRARYATQFGASRLPLLADVRRRWSLKDAHITHAWPAMPSVQWSVSPSDEDTPSLHVPGSEVQRLPRTQVVPSSGPGIQRDVQPRGAPSGFMFGEGPRKADRSTGMGQPSTGSTIEVGRSETEGEITTPAAIDTDSRGAGIVQRHVSGPAGRAVQHSAVEMRVGPKSPRRATLRRPAETEASAGQTVQEQPLVPKPAGSADQERDDDRSEASPLSVQPSAGADPSINEDGMTSSATASAGGLGPSILQRHMSSPIERSLQYKAGYQTMETRTTTPVASGQGGLGDPAVQGHPASSEPSSQAERSTAATESAATAGGRDLGASIVRRYVGGPFELAWRGPLTMPGAQPFFADTGTLQSQPVAESRQLASRVQAAPFGATGISSLKAISLQRRVDDATARLKPDIWGDAYPEVPWMQPVTAPSGSTAQRAGVFSSGVHAGDEFHPPRLEMPLARVVDYGSAGARREGAPWAQRWLVAPGAPGGILQRASAGASGGGTPMAGSLRATLPQDIGGSPPPGVDQPGLEGLDLERLADQVYTIIERRLIVEKENRGL